MEHTTKRRQCCVDSRQHSLECRFICNVCHLHVHSRALFAQRCDCFLCLRVRLSAPVEYDGADAVIRQPPCYGSANPAKPPVIR